MLTLRGVDTLFLSIFFIMKLTNIKTGKRELKKAGAILSSTQGNHDKWVNTSTGELFNMPRHGSRGRTTLSPGCSVKFNKFYNTLMEAKNEKRTNK